MGMAQEYPHSFAEALRLARKILSSNMRLVSDNLVEPEAEVLVAAAYRQVTGVKLSRLELFSRAADAFPAKAGERLLLMAHGRAEDKPLQHLTGVQQFFSNEYKVSPATLIPRPETEFLVSVALARLKALPLPPALGLEVGLGSGVISIELLHAIPGLRMRASELVADARRLAETNARMILGERESSRLEALEVADPLHVLEPFGAERADFLISNPPYVAAHDAIAPDVLAHEPVTALFGPVDDPLHFYRAIAGSAATLLKPGGQVFLEVPHERADAILALFPESTWERSLFPDLTGRNRVLAGKLWTR